MFALTINVLAEKITADQMRRAGYMSVGLLSYRMQILAGVGMIVLPSLFESMSCLRLFCGNANCEVAVHIYH